VGDHRQPQPGGVSPEVLAGQHPARQRSITMWYK
jgi:hypothetical protein